MGSVTRQASTMSRSRTVDGREIGKLCLQEAAPEFQPGGRTAGSGAESRTGIRTPLPTKHIQCGLSQVMSSRQERDMLGAIRPVDWARQHGGFPLHER